MWSEVLTKTLHKQKLIVYRIPNTITMSTKYNVSYRKCVEIILTSLAPPRPHLFLWESLVRMYI